MTEIWLKSIELVVLYYTVDICDGSYDYTQVGLDEFLSIEGSNKGLNLVSGE